MKLVLRMQKSVGFAVYCVILISSNTSCAVLKSAIKECKMHNWMNMTCCWDRYFIDGTEVIVTLKFKTFYCRSSKNNISIPQDRYRDCITPYSDGLDNCCDFLKNKGFYVVSHHLKLSSSNDSLISSSYLCLKDLQSIVQPDPVSSLKVKQLESTNIRLHWEAPAENKRFTYTISYGNGFDIPFHKINTTETDLSLNNLNPAMSYNLSIKCIFFNGSENQGFWSKPSMLEFTTLEDEPRAAPNLYPGSFMYLNESRVKIIWQTLKKSLSNGVLIKTRVKILSFPFGSPLLSPRENITMKQLGNLTHEGESLESIFETKSNEICIDLSPEKDHIIFLDQGTRIGFNNSIPLKPIVLKSFKTAPSNIKILNATVNNVGLFRFHWERLDGAYAYTFYWCPTTALMICSGSYEFETISGNSSYFEIYMPIKNTILFSNSAEHCKDGCSSGMKTIVHIYNISKPLIGPPQNFHLIESNSTTVILGWNSLLFFPEYPPYFTHYEVSYCFLPDCIDREKRFICRYSENITIEGLSFGRLMQFSIHACSSNHSCSNPAVIKVLLRNFQHWWLEIFHFPLLTGLMIFGVLAFLLLCVVLAFLSKKFIHFEPLKIDVPKCKYVI